MQGSRSRPESFFSLTLFNPLMPQPGEEVLSLLITFWEAKDLQRKSPTEPYASYERCLMELLEAILRVDGLASLQGSGLFGGCLWACLQLRAMGLQIKGVFSSSCKGEKTTAP